MTGTTSATISAGTPGRRGSRCEPLDVVEIAHADHIAPFAYLHLSFDGPIDTGRLTRAVHRVAEVVPQTLSRIDAKHLRFCPTSLSARDTVSEQTGPVRTGPDWDLCQGPQLRITVGHQPTGDSVVVGVSHVLADGRGLVQLASLLAAAYSGGEPVPPRNSRSVEPLLIGPRAGHRTHAEDVGRRLPTLSLPLPGDGAGRFCRTVTLRPHTMKALHSQAKRAGVSLNDIFIAAYARVVGRITGVTTLSLPCPADLRRFGDVRPLTIANLTGMFRVTITVGPEGLAATAAQVHDEMSRLRQRRRCFAGIADLATLHRIAPATLTRYVVRRVYSILPVSYTNLGRMEPSDYRFADLAPLAGFVTGTYRTPPEFQLGVSTFGTATTLSCALTGDQRRADACEDVLHQIAHECEQWTDSQQSRS